MGTVAGMDRRRPLRFLPLVLLALALLVPACGKEEQASFDDCDRSKQVDGVTELTIVGKNLAFDWTCVEVRPGTVELTFDNQDSGVAHNIHVTGNGVNEATDLEAGPTSQTLSVDLPDPGRYMVACDPHGTMQAWIVVAEPGSATG